MCNCRADLREDTGTALFGTDSPQEAVNDPSLELDLRKRLGEPVPQLEDRLKLLHGLFLTAAARCLYSLLF